MRKIPQGAGLYLAVLELVFALGWTVYVIYLPRLAASAGIAGAVIYILMLDQAIFTITDFAMGVAADKVSRLVGRLGHWVAAITLVSCAAFVALPFIAGITGRHLDPTVLLVLIVIWAMTSSALRAPPLMLLGKYAARPAIPHLMSLAMLGLGIAGAVSPYLALTLAKHDPRLPFIIASVALVLASLGLAKVERSLAKDAPSKPEPPKTVDRAIPVIVFALAAVIFALGFQLHFFFNSAPRFKQFTSDVSTLMPVFWVGFSVAMFPASLITKRWGGLPVMGMAGFIGAIAIVVMEFSGTFGVVVTAQLIAGAAWGCILMSAFSAAAALGFTGAEGKTTGVLFSALALATFTRMATTASGALNDPSLAPLLHWAPVVCWMIGGVVLIALSIAEMRRAPTR